MRIAQIAFQVLLAVSLLAAQVTREDWIRADDAIVRLKPDAFPNLPERVRGVLVQRGCKVPQPYDAGGKRKNVLRGQFTSSGASEWAVLCSHHKRSSILIFRAGHSAPVDRIGDEPDSQYLQLVDEGRKIGYSRLLTVASAKQVRHHIAHSNHDGIFDSFTGKASLLWYSSGGKWMKVMAGD